MAWEEEYEKDTQSILRLLQPLETEHERFVFDSIVV